MVNMSKEFDEFIEVTYRPYKDSPVYGLSMETIRTGVVMLAWNAAVEACAKILEEDADRQQASWASYISHTVPRGYAKDVRKIKSCMDYKERK